MTNTLIPGVEAGGPRALLVMGYRPDLVGHAGVIGAAAAEVVAMKVGQIVVVVLDALDELTSREPRATPGARVELRAFVGRWVRVRCGRVFLVHSEPPSSVGRVPGGANSAGPFLYLRVLKHNPCTRASVLVLFSQHNRHGRNEWRDYGGLGPTEA